MDIDQRIARLVAALAGHRGRDRGVSVEGLAGKLEISTREIRRLVSQAREAGVAICAMPEAGYFIADSSDELEDCCRFLRSRALHSLRLESQLRHIPLPDLLGQLHLTT